MSEAAQVCAGGDQYFWTGLVFGFIVGFTLCLIGASLND